MKISIIGPGKMGQALARAILQTGTSTKSDLALVHRNEEEMNKVKQSFNCTQVIGPHDAIAASDVVVLAVKPQDFAEVTSWYSPYLQSHQLIVSIMAGVSISSLQFALPQCKEFIRAMPNLPIIVQRGITAYCRGNAVVPKNIERVEKIFKGTGTVMSLESEELMDAVTAVSGSGPAYFFHLIECLTQGAQGLGFSSDDAARLVQETFLGSAALWSAETSRSLLIDPIEMKERVRSKKGTTDAALTLLEDDNVKGAYARALRAARDRGRELEKLVKG